MCIRDRSQASKLNIILLALGTWSLPVGVANINSGPGGFLNPKVMLATAIGAVLFAGYNLLKPGRDNLRSR